MKLREKILFAVMLSLLLSAPAIAGSIKVWVNRESLTAAALNANFEHIHSLMVGGHGPRLVNADVSASANISTSKIANGYGIAKAWAVVMEPCTSSPCTISADQNVLSVTRSSIGQYLVTLDYTPTNCNYTREVTANGTVVGTGPYMVCTAQYDNCTGATSVFGISCYDTGRGLDGGTKFLTDTGFNIVVHDDN